MTKARFAWLGGGLWTALGTEQAPVLILRVLLAN
jgi:hypothetical protein